MARAGLAFGSTSLQAMGLGLSPNPYAPFSPRSAQIGPSELAPARTALDLAAPYVAAVNANAQFSLPPSRAPVAPRLLYSPSTQQLYVNGSTFHQEDASSALQADQGLASPTPSAPPPSNVADWRPMSDAEYQQYIGAIRNPGLGRVFGKNVESGVRGLRQLYDYAGVYTGINREGVAADLNTIDQQNNYNDPYMRQLSDIHDVGSAAEFALAALGQGIPSILEAAAYAVAGGVVGAAVAGPGGAAGGVLAGATEGIAADGIAQIAGFSLRQSLRAGARTFMEAAARNAPGSSVETIVGSIPAGAERDAAVQALRGAREVVQNRYAFGASQLHMQALGTADTYGQAIQEGANPDTPGLRLSSAIAGIPYSLLELPDTAVEIALLRGGLSRVGRRPLRDLLAAPFAAAGYEFGAEAGQQAITEGVAQQFTGVPINPVDVLNAGAMGAVPGFLFGAGASGIHALSSHDSVGAPPAPTPPPVGDSPNSPLSEAHAEYERARAEYIAAARAVPYEGGPRDSEIPQLVAERDAAFARVMAAKTKLDALSPASANENPNVPGGAAFPTVGLHPDYVHVPENTANPAEGYNLPDFGVAPGIGAPQVAPPVNNRAAFLRRGPHGRENYNQMTQPDVAPIASVLSPPTGEELANSNPELRAHLALKGQSTAPLQQPNQGPSESNIANTALLVRLRSAFKRDNTTQVTNDELHAAENIILNRQAQPQWQMETPELHRATQDILLHVQHELQQRGEPVQWEQAYAQFQNPITISLPGHEAPTIESQFINSEAAQQARQATVRYLRKENEKRRLGRKRGQPRTAETSHLKPDTSERLTPLEVSQESHDSINAQIKQARLKREQAAEAFAPKSLSKKAQKHKNFKEMTARKAAAKTGEVISPSEVKADKAAAKKLIEDMNKQHHNGYFSTGDAEDEALGYIAGEERDINGNLTGEWPEDRKIRFLGYVNDAYGENVLEEGDLHAVQEQSTNAEAVRNESPDRPGVRTGNEPQTNNETPGKSASEGQQTQAGPQEAQVSLEQGNPEAHAAIMAELKNKSSKAKSAASIITQRFNLKKSGKPIYQYFKAHQAEYEAELTKLRETPHPVLKTAAERQVNVETQRWFADAIKEQPQLIRQAYELKNNNRADPLGVLAQHYASILRKTYGDDYIEFFGLRISPDKDATGGLREVAEQAVALARKRIADAAIKSKFNKAGGFSNSARLGQVKAQIQKFLDTKPLNSHGQLLGWDSKGLGTYAHEWLKLNDPEYENNRVTIRNDLQLIRRRYGIENRTTQVREPGTVFTLKGVERVDLRNKGSVTNNKELATLHEHIFAMARPEDVTDAELTRYNELAKLENNPLYQQITRQELEAEQVGIDEEVAKEARITKLKRGPKGPENKGSLRRPTASEFLGGNHKQAVEAVVQAWIKKNVSPHHDIFVSVFRNTKEFREGAASTYKRALSAFLEEVPGSTERDFLDWVNRTNAFISGNNVIIFSDFHQTRAGTEETLAHEILVHYGMSGIMDATDREAYLNELRAIRDQSKEVQRLISEQPKTLKYSETEQIEEALAKMGEGLESNPVKRWIAAILKFLDKIGITLDGVEAYKLLQASADFVRSGKVTSTYSSALAGSSTDVFGNPALERVATYRVIDQENPKEVFPKNGKRFSIISTDGRMAIVDAIEGGLTNNPALDFYDAAIEAGSPLNYVHVIYTPDITPTPKLYVPYNKRTVGVNDNEQAQVDINIVGPLSRSQKVSILKTIAAAPAGINIHVKAILANDFGFGKSYASTIDNRDELTPAGARALLNKIPINDSRLHGSPKDKIVQDHAIRIGANDGFLYNIDQTSRAKELLDVLKNKGQVASQALSEGLAHLNTLRDKALRSPGLWELYKLLLTMNESKEYMLRQYRAMRPHSFNRLGVNATSNTQLLKAGKLLGYASINRLATLKAAELNNAPDLGIESPTGEFVLDKTAVEAAIQRGMVPKGEFSKLGVYVGENKSRDIDLSAEANSERVYDIYEENWRTAAQGHLDKMLARINDGVNSVREAKDSVVNMFNKNAKRALTASEIATINQITDTFNKLYFADNSSNTKQAAENFLTQVLRTMHSKEALKDFVGPDMPDITNKKGNTSEVVAAYVRTMIANEADEKTSLAAAKSMPETTEDEKAKKQETVARIEHNIDVIQDFKKIVASLNDLNSIGIDKGTQTKARGILGHTALSNAQIEEAQKQAKRSIMGGHVSLERTGTWMTRVVAIDKDTGKPVPLGDEFPMPFFQSGEENIAKQIAEDLNGEFKNNEWQVQDKFGVDHTVTFKSVYETAHKDAQIVENINFNAFLRMIEKAGIKITPSERARIIVSLTNMDSRARKSIMRMGNPGWNPDVIGSLNTQLEATARIASKMENERRMMALWQNESFWKGDEALLNELQQSFHDAVKSGNKARVILAEKSLLEYANMFAEVSPIDPKSPTVQIETTKGKQELKKRGHGEYMRNEGNKLMRFIRSSADPAVSTEDLINKHGGPLSIATVMAQLGFSIATATMNVISSPMTFISYMSSFNHQTGYGHGFGTGEAAATFFSAMRRMAGNPLKGEDLSSPAYLKKLLAEKRWAKHGLTEESLYMLIQETEGGILSAAYQTSMGGAGFNQLRSTVAQQGVEAWMAPFSYSEMLNRRASALAAFELISKRKLDSKLISNTDLLDHTSSAYKDLVSDVTDVVHITQGNYSMSNRPELYRGNILQHILKYKMFPTMIVEMISHLPTSGKLKMLAILWFMSGLKGLPFADDLMDLIDFILQSLGIKQASFEAAVGNLANDILPGASPVILRGVLDSTFGATFSTRAGLGDLIPFTGIGRHGADMGRELQSALGPVYSMASSSVSYAALTSGYVYQQLGLAPHTTSFADLIRQNPATGLRSVGEPFLYMQDGAITNQQGRVTSTDINPFTIAMRFAGFSPTSLTRENDAVRLARYHDQYISSIKTAFVSAYAQARRAGNQDRMAQIRQEVQSWNEAARAANQEDFVIRDFMGSALRSSRTNTLSASERYAESAPRNTSLRRTVQIATGENQ